MSAWLVCVALESIHRAVIVAEASVLDEPKPEALVEPARAVVGRHRVDQDAAHGRVGEAAVDGQSHHLRAEPAAEERFLTNPDVDSAQPGGAVAPVMTIFAGRVDDLDEANGRTFDFRDELFAPALFAAPSSDAHQGPHVLVLDRDVESVPNRHDFQPCAHERLRDAIRCQPKGLGRCRVQLPIPLREVAVRHEAVRQHRDGARVVVEKGAQRGAHDEVERAGGELFVGDRLRGPLRDTESNVR